MPDIGTTLRGARERQRIDILTAEAATKIRGRYLRALEEEDFGQLPGPAYVVSFLRTYAEYLGLDARAIVEEYRLGHERLGPTELAPLGPGLRNPRPPRRSPVRIGPRVLAVFGVALLLGALYLLGTWGDDPERAAEAPTATPRPTATAEAAAERSTPRRRRRTAPRRVNLRVVATGEVYVCLVDAMGRQRIDGATLSPGSRRGPYRSGRFRVTFGNGAARMVASGRTVEVPDRERPIGYDVRPGRAPREVAPANQVTCD